MLKILDWYILKRYLGTFFSLFLIFIPIAILANLAEKIDNIFEQKLPFLKVLEFYGNFSIHFAYLLFPLLLFISVIWFTSKLANNTEIVAFLSSGVSFSRFLRPYLIGATIVALLAIFLGMFLAPEASKGFNDFDAKYLSRKKGKVDNKNVFRQVNDNDYIYVSSFNIKDKIGQNFTLEHIENSKVIYKIEAQSIRFVIGEHEDKIEKSRKKDTIFSFDLEDLTPVEYIAETLTYGDLTNFIKKEEKRGSSNIGRYKLVKYRKWSLPVSVFILTIIAVAVSSIKRRGGMGVNLAFGICIAMIFVFFDKIFGVMAAQSNFSPLLAVWFPNILFGILALYLLYHAKR